MLKKVAVLLAVLAVGFALLMLTARDASFTVRSSLAVDCPPAAVWTVLTSVDRWPAWWPGVEQARIEPGWRAGAALTLVLKGDPGRTPATVEAVTPGRSLVWQRPGILGSTTRTTVELEPAAGGTLVHLESAIHGPQAFLARFTGREAFAGYHQAVLAGLRSRTVQSATGENG